MGVSWREALVFVLQAFVHLYVFVLLLRLLLPWMRVSLNNPLTQAILRATSPVVVPLRRLLPPVGRVDTATVIVAYAIEYLLTLVIVVIVNLPILMVNVSVTALVRLLVLGLWLYIIAIIIRVILSWTGGGQYNPAMDFVEALAEPALRPFRRIIRPAGGFDFSAFIAIVLLIALTILVGGLKMYPRPL
ncbi:MAG: YggT family protein [Woeseiaceae bacterium]|nr:YggT family protein [Woeseiaceae bacterium]